jgi:aromatic ring-opening dioxygenase catalytic subunit (LigB family)
MNPIAYVHPDKYVAYQLNVDIPTAKRCIEMLRKHGVDAHENPNFDWIHDTFLILIRMFPDKCPPTVIISQNARYDPHFHMRIGSILRPLRKEGYLMIGSGGAVHNLYRNNWSPMVTYRDNFAMPTPPQSWALDFRQAFEDAVTKNSGPELRRAVTRLMKHPEFRNAHGTDEHFIPAVFVAGAAGDVEDDGVYGHLAAEDWELVSLRDCTA